VPTYSWAHYNVKDRVGRIRIDPTAAMANLMSQLVSLDVARRLNAAERAKCGSSRQNRIRRQKEARIQRSMLVRGQVQ
jgi:hypothetical protein